MLQWEGPRVGCGASWAERTLLWWDVAVAKETSVRSSCCVKKLRGPAGGAAVGASVGNLPGPSEADVSRKPRPTGLIVVAINQSSWLPLSFEVGVFPDCRHRLSDVRALMSSAHILISSTQQGVAIKQLLTCT